MFKFFRTIRQRLLTENRITKYLLYAVGEILLVVIGILIALQVNKWNESQTERRIEADYLERLITDLRSDTAYYSDMMDRAQDIMDSHRHLVGEMYKKQESLSEARALLQNNLDFTPLFLHINDKTITELISTGSMSTIRNDTVRSAIFDYYNSVEQAKRHIEEWNANSGLGLAQFWYSIPELIKIIYEPDMYNEQQVLDNEWEFINNPDSRNFRLLERIARTYRSKNADFQNYSFRLKGEAEALMLLINQGKS